MRTHTLIATGALAIAGLTTACQPAELTSHEAAHVDVLRIDCTQPGWFSVQTSASGGETLELRTGSGVVARSVPAEDGVHRTSLQDWHPTRGGHIDKVRAVLVEGGSVVAQSAAGTTPYCGVVLEPEASDVS